MRGIVVFREDTTAVLSAQNEDGVNREEGHIWSHDCDCGEL
jgi:hypothetical protein